MTSFQRNIQRRKIKLIATHAKTWAQVNTPLVARIMKLTPPSI